jgi:hypothetical protein
MAAKTASHLLGPRYVVSTGDSDQSARDAEPDPPAMALLGPPLANARTRECGQAGCYR